jgi:hypothetical protein
MKAKKVNPYSATVFSLLPTYANEHSSPFTIPLNGIYRSVPA